MTQEQWQTLLCSIEGGISETPNIGFIIDSPWLPGWAGCSTMDYFGSNETWFDVNLKAIQAFSDAIFLPGFWSEYGEITEPSAFGCKLTWDPDNLPHAHKIIHTREDVTALIKPNVTTDGMLSLAINRLQTMEPKINQVGHQIKFAVSRGPFNIASFLMGASEFFTAMMLEPKDIHQLLRTITDFTRDWLICQKQCFPSIDGIMILDDLIGFVGQEQCSEFAVPYLKEIYSSFDANVKFFHNDAEGIIIGRELEDIGVNIYNFSFKHSMSEMRNACGDKVVLLGNIPPRDVLAAATCQEVKQAAKVMYESIEDKRRIIWSCGGGVPQGVSTDNLNAFIEQILLEQSS